MSGDASRPPDYYNHQKNIQKGPGFKTGILVTAEEYVLGFQVHHIPLNLEGSGAVEVPGVISDYVPETTSSKSPIFQVHHLFLQVLSLPIFLSPPLL